MKKNKIYDRVKLIEEPLAHFDWILFLIIGGFCFLAFQHTDLLHTGGSSIAYLNGHFPDFYEYNATLMGGNNYIPSTYILFALWNIPIHLLGLVAEPTMNVSYFVLMWYKLLPTVFYFLSAYVLYKIAKNLGLSTKKAKIASYLFLTTPIAFFSQFLFGQYDSLTLFFVLLGVLYYLRCEHMKFVLMFGIALTFKYTALLLFIPLLLLREKRISKIIISMLSVLMPFVLLVIPYINSPVFRKGVFGFGAIGYITQSGFNIGGGSSVSIVIVGFLFICAWAYFTTPKNKTEESQYAFFFCNGVFFLIFGLSLFHPQWLLLAMPFLVLSTMMNKNTETFLLIDLIMMISMTGFTVNFWINHADQQLLAFGFLKPFTLFINDIVTMRDLYIIKDTTIWYSILSACFLINFVFKHPKFTMKNIKDNINYSWGVVRARFLLGIGSFVVPALICLVISNVFSPVFTPNIDNLTPFGAMHSESTIVQNFVSKGDSFSKISITFGTYNRSNSSDLKLELVDENNNIIFKEIIDTNILVDNEIYEIETKPIKLVKGESYNLKIIPIGTNDDDFVTIYKTDSLDSRFNGNAIVNGKEQDYNFAISINRF